MACTGQVAGIVDKLEGGRAVSKLHLCYGELCPDQRYELPASGFNNGQLFQRLLNQPVIKRAIFERSRYFGPMPRPAANGLLSFQGLFNPVAGMAYPQRTVIFSQHVTGRVKVNRLFKSRRYVS